MSEVPLIPAFHELPEAVQALREERWRKFVWFYVFGGANGAAAARMAGYSNASEGAKVQAHSLLQRNDIQDAIKALTGKYLFSLAPKAILRLEELLDKPDHAKHVKAIELTLDRVGHPGKTAVDVNVSGSVTLSHTEAALDDLARLLALRVPRTELEQVFGHSGLPRYERMLLERERRAAPVIEGEVVK